MLLDLADQPLVPRLQRVEALADHLVGLGIELAERQILEFLAHLVHAHAAGERRIDVDRLLGDAPALLGRHMRQRAHVVQPVGELDQQHAHVVGDRQQELAQVLRLLRLLGDEVELLELGQALDQRADVVAEHLVDLGAGRGGILDGVVQQGGRDGGVVELEVGQDRRHFERMREIGVAGGALLLAVRLHGVDIGAVEQRLAGVRIVALDALDQVVLPHHLRLRRLGRFYWHFNGLSDQIETAVERRPGPGLVLHPRQVGRRTRHEIPCAGHRLGQPASARYHDMAHSPQGIAA